MSQILIHLPESLATRVAQTARQRRLDPDCLARRLIESHLLLKYTSTELDAAILAAADEEDGAVPSESTTATRSFYERNKDLIVEDEESPHDLATNPIHMEGYGT